MSQFEFNKFWVGHRRMYEKLDIAAANKDTLNVSVVVMDYACNIVYMMTRSYDDPKKILYLVQ